MATSLPDAVRELSRAPGPRTRSETVPVAPGAVWATSTADALFTGVAAVGLAVLVSNPDKGEVELIYLPFAVWPPPFAATLAPAPLPGRGVPAAARILVAVRLGGAVVVTAAVRTWW